MKSSQSSFKSSSFSIITQPRFDIYEKESALTGTRIYLIDLGLPGLSLFLGKIGKNELCESDFVDIQGSQDSHNTDRLLFWVEATENENEKTNEKTKINFRMSLKHVMDEVKILMDMMDDPFFLLDDIPGFLPPLTPLLPPPSPPLFPLPESEFDHIEDIFYIQHLFVEETEWQSKRDLQKRLYECLTEMAADIYRGFVASRRIQRVWREVVANPSFQVCRKRLRYEFEELEDDF